MCKIAMQSLVWYNWYIDDGCRYAYDRQPSICRWNLTKLAEALEPSGLTEEMKQEGLKLYVSYSSLALCNGYWYVRYIVVNF